MASIGSGAADRLAVVAMGLIVALNLALVTGALPTMSTQANISTAEVPAPAPWTERR